MREIESGNGNDVGLDISSSIVYNAMEEAMADLEAGLETTYATFIRLIARNGSLVQALQGYDALLEDLATNDI